MGRFGRLVLACFILSAVSAPLCAQESADSLDRDYAVELPRIPPLSPSEALDSFRIHEGFRVEQVAAEPLVFDPIAMAFDERGRLYVVEMRGYSERRDENIGAVRLLEDTDGDGTFDTSAVFADGLAWPTAVACYDGGVFVGVPPDILYLKDSDGDGHADLREVAFTGFGLNNVQGLLNSFNWGLDDVIHGATSGSGGSVTAAAYPFEPALSLRGRDFAIEPRTRRIEPISGGAQHGLTFDDWGRKFVCHNSDHLIQIMYEDRYLARNSLYAASGPRVSIAVDGPQAEVYRISAVEPWRTVRTRLRVQGLVPGPIEGGGRASGYFTSATGVTVYRGDAWPDAYRGNVFVGDVGGNLVHRKTMTREGLAYRGDRADANVEFLASTDIWFRPVQFCNGPDGCLYVADMYREVIEHPDSLPPIIKKHLDLNSGFDRGRIYRIAPEGFRVPAIPDLGALPSAELVPLLGHRNAWHAETAQRLLYERADASVVPLLHGLAQHGPEATGRMRAMYALRSLDALTEADVRAALDSESFELRRHGARLAESIAEPTASLREELLALDDDPDVEVRYQAAFTLGTWDWPERDDALAKIARRDGGDTWMRTALLSSLRDGAGAVAANLLADEKFLDTADAAALLRALGRQTGAAGDVADVTGCLAALEALPETRADLRDGTLESILLGARDSGAGVDVRRALEQFPLARAAVTRLIASAMGRATDRAAPVDARVEAIKTLTLASPDDSIARLGEMVSGESDLRIRRAALSTLSHFDDARVAELLIERLGTLPNDLRSPALDVLLSRDDGTRALLDAIDSDRIAYAELPSTNRHRLKQHPDPAIRARVARLEASLAPADVQQVLAGLAEAPTLDGDPAAGLAIFLDRCAACHRAQGYGQSVGPDLAGVRDWDKPRLMTAILQPNSDINPQFTAYSIETTDGRYLSGILDAETATSVTLKMNGSSPTVLKSQIRSVSPMEISLMPEELVFDLDAQGIADLMAFLKQE